MGTEPFRVALNEYEDIRPLLRHVRVMLTVTERSEDFPSLRDGYGDLMAIFEAVLQEEFAPSAFDQARPLDVAAIKAAVARAP